MGVFNPYLVAVDICKGYIKIYKSCIKVKKKKIHKSQIHSFRNEPNKKNK